MVILSACVKIIASKIVAAERGAPSVWTVMGQFCLCVVCPVADSVHRTVVERSMCVRGDSLYARQCCFLWVVCVRWADNTMLSESNRPEWLLR